MEVMYYTQTVVSDKNKHIKIHNNLLIFNDEIRKKTITINIRS